MKTVTIPDPAEVAAMLDREFPSYMGHSPVYGKTGWSCTHWPSDGGRDVWAMGKTPEKLLAELCKEIGQNSPLERLRREADALNLQLIPKP
jgi:hypothetical protein